MVLQHFHNSFSKLGNKAYCGESSGVLSYITDVGRARCQGVALLGDGVVGGAVLSAPDAARSPVLCRRRPEWIGRRQSQRQQYRG
jgi:hypothetical protein